MKKSLTFQYTFHQMAYWATAAGAMSFATAFLLAKGFAATQVGILLASGNLLSCLLQPILADRADRIGGNIVKWLIAALTGLCMVCFGSIQLLAMPQWLFGLLYLLGIFAILLLIFMGVRKNGTAVFVGQEQVGVLEDKKVTAEYLIQTLESQLEGIVGSKVKVNEEIDRKSVV